jgi:hypothetical protein
MYNYLDYTTSLPSFFGQAFLFEKNTKPYKTQKNNFIPKKQSHKNLSKKLEESFLHLSALVNYELSFGWPQSEKQQNRQHTSWQQLHDLGLIALVDSTTRQMLLVIKHYCAITQRPFFDYSKIKNKSHTKTHTLKTQDNTCYIISDLLLTILTTQKSITFIKKTSDITPDEQAILKYILQKKGSLSLDGKNISYNQKPIFMRYIHIKEDNHSQDTSWREDMKTIIYF